VSTIVDDAETIIRNRLSGMLDEAAPASAA